MVSGCVRVTIRYRGHRDAGLGCAECSYRLTLRGSEVGQLYECLRMCQLSHDAGARSTTCHHVCFVGNTEAVDACTAGQALIDGSARSTTRALIGGRLVLGGARGL